MWLQQCIKDACISHIWTRASLIRDPSHCLLSVSKLFVSGITPERMRFSSNLCTVLLRSATSTSLSIYEQFGPLVDFILSIYSIKFITSHCIDRFINFRTSLSSNNSIFCQWIHKISIYNFSLPLQCRNPFPIPSFDISSPLQGNSLKSQQWRIFRVIRYMYM